jgi:hypothetical protein
MEGADAVEVSGEAPSTNGPSDCFICSSCIWRFGKETPLCDFHDIMVSHRRSTAQPSHFDAVWSGLDYLRLIGVCLKNEILEKIGGEGRAFFVGIDTSNRNGSLGAYVVSSVALDGSIDVEFLEFDRPDSGDAETLFNGLVKIIDKLQDAGGTFHGFSSDAPATMAGEISGVAARVIEKYGLVRFDTCEFHASGRVLAVIEKVFPAQMNVASVNQFIFLAWYILNSDWSMFRGMIIQYITDKPSQILLNRFQGATKQEKRADALEQLGKPAKPMPARWRTVADTLWFVNLYWEALQFAFEKERFNGGANAKTGSTAAMCAQWIKWSGSKKLRALFEFVLEYVNDVWWPFEQQIGYRNEEHALNGCNGVYFRTRRVLAQLMLVEGRLQDVSKLKSFEITVAAFGEEKQLEVKRLYERMYGLACESILRNSGRYLSGIRALASLADPEFVHIVYEVLCHYLKRKKGRMPTSAEGRRLLRCFQDAQLGDAEREKFDLLTGSQSWESIEALVKAARKSPKDLAKMILEAPEGNYLLSTLRCWRGSLSNTQSVERMFLHYDNQTRGSGQSKSKASEPSGKSEFAITTEAKVHVAAALSTAAGIVLERRDKPKKQAIVADQQGVAQQTDLVTRALTFTPDQLAAGKLEAKASEDLHRQPRHGISRSLQEVFANLEKAVPGFIGPRLLYHDLIASGQELDISLAPLCSADCLQLQNVSKKGRWVRVQCKTCQCEFHVKCMIAEGVLDGQMKKDVQHIRFSCSSCGGSLESNKPSGERRVGDQLPSITPSAPLKAVGKSGQKGGVHAQSSQQREAPQDPPPSKKPKKKKG